MIKEISSIDHNITIFYFHSWKVILVSIAFHTVDPTFKIVISKNLTFDDSDFLQAFKCGLKRFLLPVELNHLGILE